MKLRVAVVLITLVFSSVCVSSEDHRESKTLPKVTNEAYKRNCGTCHFAYQPGLLPSRSWQKIINDQGGHPGGDLSLDCRIKSEIREYLSQNSAEKTRSKRSRKILASIGANVPTRISDVPYVREKHRKVREEVFLRKSIGSRGNCIACHRTAENGDYDDDNVTIPK